MGYFEAVQLGKLRVEKSVELLQAVVGPCSPMLFLKIKPEGWEPVGEENLFSVIAGKGGTAAVVLCDSDGNTKAMSAWVPEPVVLSHAKTLTERGFPKFEGEVKLPI